MMNISSEILSILWFIFGDEIENKTMLECFAKHSFKNIYFLICPF